MIIITNFVKKPEQHPQISEHMKLAGFTFTSVLHMQFNFSLLKEAVAIKFCNQHTKQDNLH